MQGLKVRWERHYLESMLRRRLDGGVIRQKKRKKATFRSAVSPSVPLARHMTCDFHTPQEWTEPNSNPSCTDTTLRNPVRFRSRLLSCLFARHDYRDPVYTLRLRRNLLDGVLRRGGSPPVSWRRGQSQRRVAGRRRLA